MSNFTHTPRPAITTDRPGCEWQRRFGPGKAPLDYSLKPEDRESQVRRAELDVFRDSKFDLAELSIHLGLYTCASITARLNPEELRDLAARLIDAAHDIETLPAAVLAQEAA